MLIHGPLLACAIGDAIGAGCEYADNMIPEVLKFEGYVQHPTHTELKPGMYTDDTQMSLALAELMLTDKKWDQENIMSAFFLTYKRDPRDGYSRGFQSILDNSPHLPGFIAHVNPTSNKSGAAMRASVVGLYPDERDVFVKTLSQVTCTHHSKIGIASALMVAFATHALYYKKIKFNFEELRYYLKSKIGDFMYIDEENRFPFPLGQNTKILSQGYWAPCAALTDMFDEYVEGSNGCVRQLSRVIRRTGDTDTACAILMSVLSSAKNNLYVPKELYEGLENGSYGRDYLISVDEELKKKFPQP